MKPFDVGDHVVPSKTKKDGWIAIKTGFIDVTSSCGIAYLPTDPIPVGIFETKEQAEKHGIPVKIEWEEEV